MSIAIIIPARYGSTRFPGKPLAMLAGQTMLQRVWSLAEKAAEGFDNIQIAVATDDQRIADHANDSGMRVLMTSADYATGSDRVLAAAKMLDIKPEIVINLQGDAPLTPINAIRAIIDAFEDYNRYRVVTPVMRLSWDALDRLRQRKEKSPFSGTTCVTRPDGKAQWFSKQIIPAIRGEDSLRQTMPNSPILQHIGLYGYRMDVLEQFNSFNISTYEQLEGLEQLRLIENRIPIHTVEVSVDEVFISSGVDTPEDMARVETLIQQHGEPMTRVL